jgi:hypothetical protein
MILIKRVDGIALRLILSTIDVPILLETKTEKNPSIWVY